MKSNLVISFLLILLFISSRAYSQQWKQYEDSGKVYKEQQKLDKAIEFYSKAREELKKDSIGTGSYATSCNGLAILYNIKGEYEKSEPLFLEAKQIREK